MEKTFIEKSFVRGTWQQKRSFSPAVITEGNQTIVWVAGHTGATADDGRSLAGDFDAQFHQVFSNIDKTLA
jgi:2-iminobutanoate/2-iminopropanoate deaminase